MLTPLNEVFPILALQSIPHLECCLRLRKGQRNAAPACKSSRTALFAPQQKKGGTGVRNLEKPANPQLGGGLRSTSA
jgi:hypothetical protein